MDRLNLTTSLGNNTGKTAGDVRMGRIKALLFTRGFVLAASDLASSDSIKTALTAAALKARTDVTKLIVIDGFREAEDGTGDPNVANLADGYEEVLNEALPKYTFKTTKGTAQQMSLTALNGWNDGAYILDDKNILWYIGTKTGGAKPFSIASFYAQPPKFGGTGAINTSSVKVTFGSVEEFKSMIGAVKLDFTMAELPNVVDVQLKEAATATATILKVAVETKYAGTDIYATYADGLAQAGAWKVTKLADGTNVPVTASPKNATTKGWDVTIGAGVAAGKYLVELVDPTALAALNTPVEGIEGYSVVITKP